MRTVRGNVTGWYLIGGKRVYLKSLLERAWACVLELCKLNPNMGLALFGYEIVDWKYESFRFDFYGDNLPFKKGQSTKRMKGRRHGVTCYKPDFKIIRTGDATIWHEVKGVMMPTDLTKLRCLSTYYPNEKLEVIINGMPTGRTTLGRRTLIRYNKCRQYGYKVIDAKPIIKSLGRWLDAVIVMEMGNERQRKRIRSEFKKRCK